MLEQTLAIIRNTFFESIRQPIVFVLLVIATILLIVANLTATFTMEDDQKMLVDVGLATIFLFGALIASFIATNVLTREIENKTVLTVVSKPVGRPLFVIGKYLGVAGAILIASLYMAFAFMLIEHHGTIQTVRDPVHLPVLVFGIGAAVISFVVAVWCNYLYGKVFASTFICVAAPLGGLAYFLSLLFDAGFSTETVELTNAFNSNLWSAVVTLIVANLVLTAIAVAVSTRLNQIMTIIVTIGFFLLGLLSDWLFGALMFKRVLNTAYDRAEQAGAVAMLQVHQDIALTSGESGGGVRELAIIVDDAFNAATPKELQDLEYGNTTLEQLGLHVADWSFAWDFMSGGGDKFIYMLGRAGHSILPNFQVLWLSEAVTQGHVIPTTYLVQSLIYGGLTIGAALALAVILFQRREVG